MSVSVQTTAANPIATDTSLLRRAIQVDMIFVLASSLIFIIFSAQLAALTGLAASILLAVGIACLAYAAFLGWAQRNMPIRQLGWVNVGVGYTWVVASIILLATGWLPLTSFGFWVIVFLAIDVDILTSVQAYTLIKRK